MSSNVFQVNFYSKPAEATENLNQKHIDLIEMVLSLLKQGFKRVDIGQKIGLTHWQVGNYIRLGKLDPKVMKMLQTEIGGRRSKKDREFKRKTLISFRMAIEIARLRAEEQFPFAQMLVEKRLGNVSARVLVNEKLNTIKNLAI